MLQPAGRGVKNAIGGLQKARIDDFPLLFACELAQLVRLRSGERQYVPHRHTSHRKGIGE
jgi:hypothetical protein